jgi:hypothetical protein
VGILDAVHAVFVHKQQPANVDMTHEAAQQAHTISTIGAKNAIGDPDPYPAPIIPIKHRDEFGKLLDRIGAKVGIEIGVYQGDYINTVLSKWPTFEKVRFDSNSLILIIVRF